MTVQAYSSQLQCWFHGWSVLGAGELALDMPEGAICEHKECQKIANHIMPDVWRIVEFHGGIPCVEHRWASFLGWNVYDISPEIRRGCDV